MLMYWILSRVKPDRDVLLAQQESGGRRLLAIRDVKEERDVAKRSSQKAWRPKGYGSHLSGLAVPGSLFGTGNHLRNEWRPRFRVKGQCS